MDWRLNKLIVQNFKFFCNEFILPVDCKNILIYGENGSGKSSIYWSLYTILQSCLKSNATVASKYFDAIQRIYEIVFQIILTLEYVLNLSILMDAPKHLKIQFTLQTHSIQLITSCDPQRQLLDL